VYSKRYQRGGPELSSLLASENVSTLILQERRDAGLPFRIVLEQHAEHGDAPHALGLVWARRERPCGAKDISMAGLCAPLPTLRCRLRRRPRTARGRCGSLLLHRIGLAPTTHCRSPGALRKIPYLSRHHGLFGNIHFDLITSRPPASSHQLSFRTSESLPRM